MQSKTIKKAILATRILAIIGVVVTIVLIVILPKVPTISLLFPQLSILHIFFWKAGISLTGVAVFVGLMTLGNELEIVMGFQEKSE